MSELEQVFDQVWTELAAGRSSIDDVLARYPEHAEDLRKMLAAASWLRGAPKIEVSRAARARGRRRLVAHMAANPRTRGAGLAFIQTLFMRRLAPALAGLALVLTVGTAAAQAAGPGDLLYPWRQASEVAWLTVSPDQPGTALAVAERRAQDLLQTRQGTRQFDLAAQAYQSWIVRIVERGVMDDQIEQAIEMHQQMFDDLGIQVPVLQGLLDAETQEPALPTPELTPPALPTIGPVLPDPLDLLN